MARKPLPPGPKSHLWGGHLAELNRDWLGTYAQYARQYGDVVSYRIGPFRSALVSHPALIEHLLVDRAASLRKSPIQRLIQPLVGEGIFLREGDSWKRQRRLVSPPFHRQRIARYGEAMIGIAERIAEEMRPGETRDIHRDTTRLALRIVSATLFGTDTDRGTAEVEAVLARAMRALTARLDTVFPLPNWMPTPSILGLRAARRDLDALIDDFITKRRSRSESATDLISLLLATRDADTNRGLTDREVRDEAVTIFVAGFETTAITLAWAFWLLAHHPEAASRLAVELHHVLAGRSLGADDLPRLKFTESIVLETLRLYPPAWLIARQTTEDVEVGDFCIPKGWNVEFSQWVTHRDPRFFERPEAFEPERWLTGLAARLPRFAYFPFGGGPRVCIGSSFAMMEAISAIAVFASRWTFEPDDSTTVKPDPGFTLRPAPGPRLTARRARATPLSCAP